MRGRRLSPAGAALVGLAAGIAPLPARAAALSAPSPRVVIASDSTASVYAPDQFPQMGWGMFLRCALPADATVDDRARGGRSTRTFIQEGLWGQLVATLRPGDTVLIQFGHNDEDLTKPWRHTDAEGDYRLNLTRFVAQVRAHGAIPVLLTPVARAEFSDGHTVETHDPYTGVVRSVAADTETPLIDLDAHARTFLDQQGQKAGEGYYLIYTAADHVARFPDGHRDTTHLNERGARMVAALVAQDLAKLGLPVSAEVHAPDPATVPQLGTPVCR